MTRMRVLVAAVLLGPIVIGVLLLWPGDDRYEVTAVFEQSYGIVPGDRVMAGGAAVGAIAGIRLGSDGRPHVRLRIDKGYRLRRGATADLQLFSSSGEVNRIVVLQSGHGARLADGALIPAQRTDQPVELDDVLNAVTPAMRADLRAVVGEVDGATSNLDDAFRKGLRHSAQALDETAALLHETARDGVALRTSVRGGAAVSAAFADGRDGLGESVAQLRELLSTTAARQATLRQTVQALPEGLGGPRRALDRVRAALPDVEQLVGAAAPAAHELGPAARQLDPTLRAAQPTLEHLVSTLHQAPTRLRSLIPLLKIAEPTATTLAPTLRDALPALDVLRAYTPEIAGFLSNWTGIASTYDAAGNGLRIMLAGQSPTNTLRSSDSTASGYIPRPFMRTPGALVGEPWTDYTSSFLSAKALRP
jgi:phospholipid/cholesterol/gamma-HCH transport system substrate-binding protein